MTWLAIVLCAAACYGLKLAGLSVPASLLERPVVRRVADLLPVALLGALIAVQVMTGDGSSGPELVLDARLGGLGAAVLALVLRAPFLVVVIVSAVAAALIRLL